ncbi:BglII/BstYI family type II restriction endonuclease [Pelagerythrobacter sp.]|uniref:BglII/BstYI family type II restriction endonuclease n=1 Tax=Pelagerythrobacter sp. TaxID=2800702 RepID=UPI0035B1C2CE
MFDRLLDAGFEIQFASHARAILSVDFPDIVKDLEAALLTVSLPITEIVGSGGGEAQLTQRLRRAFHQLGWAKRNIKIEKMVDGVLDDTATKTHEIDHFFMTDLGNFALEIEWNNKDPFFDRDLENFKRLHSEGVVGVGAILTRGSELQASLKDMVRGWAERERIASFADLKGLGFKRPTERQEEIVARWEERGDTFPQAWSAMFCNDKYGMATTHWDKLQARVRRGVGNPCPLLLIGLPPSIVDLSA